MTDSSPMILKEYADKDQRLKVISKSNSGYGHTMNVGLDRATGEYIGIVETDDYVKPEMYETLYEIAKANDLDFIRADFERFVGDGEEREFTYVPLTKEKQYYNRVIDPSGELNVFRFTMNNWTGIYNREFLNRYHILHNETPGASYQDNGFWFQVFARAKRGYFLDKPLYQVRRDNPNSSVHSKSKVFCACDEYEYIKEFLNENPELKERFIGVYSLKRLHNYMFTYSRIAEEFRPMFLERFSQDFKEAMENGELDRDWFTRTEWKRIESIIADPEKYYAEEKAKENTVKAIPGNMKQQPDTRRFLDKIKDKFFQPK